MTAMLFDSHIHTCFSADSEMTATEALEAAKRQNVGLVFTEHIDFSYPGAKAFLFDPLEYWQAYEKLRGDSLSLGVEVGLVPGEAERAAAFVAAVPFDEVIGSIHLLDGRDLYERDTYENRGQDETYRAYLALMAAMVRANPFIDILGHIDYIARYAPYEEPGVRYDCWPDEIDSVLRAAIAADIVLELNTRRFADRLAMKELVPIFRRYRELGGRAITLGSDAHAPDAVAAHFALARDFAEACALAIVTFRERRPVTIGL